MAATAIFILLTISSTIHARESQFFNKFSNNIPKESQPLATDQQDPNFIPQSQDSDAYGLYGHESGQLHPSATTHNNLPANLPENYNPVAYTTPIHSSTQHIPDEYKDPQAYQYNGESKMYNSEKQGMSDTRFLENGKYYYAGGNAYGSKKQGFDDARFVETEDGGNINNSEKQGEEMYKSQKQGMSDTRYFSNGKYYYDINGNMHARGFNSRNEYNTQGYYGNNENSYDGYNSNGGYQNQEDQFNP